MPNKKKQQRLEAKKLLRPINKLIRQIKKLFI